MTPSSPTTKATSTAAFAGLAKAAASGDAAARAFSDLGAVLGEIPVSRRLPR